MASIIINLPESPFNVLESADNLAALRALPSADLANGTDVIVDGSVTSGDGAGGLYTWNELSTADDDGISVIKPDDVAPLAAGRWILTNASQGGLLAELAGPEGADLVGFRQTGTGAVDRTLLDKERERIAYGDHGTLDQTIVAAGSQRDVDLAGQSVTLAGEPVNQYGARLRNGKVLVPSGIGSYLTQRNTYADDANGIMIGRENLAAWWKSVSAGTFQSIFIYGDSTVEMDAGYPLKSHQLYKQALYAAGVNNCLTVNRGVSGTSWSDLNILPDLGPTTKKVVIKDGINDAVKTDPLDTLMAAARSKLAAIRAATNGDFANLSILLMGPNSTYRPSTGQDAKWYEDLRNGYLQLCKEFDCAYFDTYAYLQQTRHAPGLWLDNIGGSGEGLHPDAVAAYWIWFEGIKTHVLGDGQWNTIKANQHWNIAHATTQQYPTSEPQTYPFGDSNWGVLASDGWPANGALKVYRQADGTTTQELLTLDVVPRRMVRTGAGLVWTQWTGIQTAIGTFLNSWVNEAGGFHPAAYMPTTEGFVKLFGVIQSGVSGSAAFNLPAAVRPAYAHRFDVEGGNIVIFADGNVIPTVTSNAQVTLDGIEFPAL